MRCYIQIPYSRATYGFRKSLPSIRFHGNTRKWVCTNVKINKCRNTCMVEVHRDL